MNISIPAQSTRGLLLFMSFLFLMVSGLKAQQSTIEVIPPTPPNGTIYQFRTTNLNPEDLVFYRFSDGHDKSAISTSSLPGADVRREFKSSVIKVSAYIARKNGPIGFASTVVSPVTQCSGCTMPQRLPTGTKIQIRPTSWDPFDDPNAAQPFTDNTISSPFPAFVAPTTPWFILPVSLKPNAAGYAEITIPSNVTFAGVFIKSKWIPFIQPSPNEVSTQGDPHVSGITYLPTKVKLSLGTLFNDEFNVFLVFKNSTTLGQTISFSCALYASNGSLVENGNTTSFVTHHNPHDPNHFINFEEGVCRRTMMQQPMRYRIEFQNMGAGKAEIVKTKAIFDPSVVNTASIIPTSITSSHPLSAYIVGGTESIGFIFNDINLPGLNRDPQPQLEETEGWVEFTVMSNTCINSPFPQFLSEGSVTFIGNSGTFTETIATNNIKQIFTGACPVDCPAQSETSGSKENDWINGEAGSYPRCFPSQVEDILNIEYKDISENGALKVEIMDLNGIKHLEGSYLLSAGESLNVELSTQTLPKGMLLVRFVQGKHFLVQKVIKF